jgi:hypothetical protein
MSLLRPPRIDPDINWASVKSRIITELAKHMDSFFDDEDSTYHFVDIQNRFFVSVLDYEAQYDYGLTVKDLEIYGETFQLPDFEPMFVPIIRAFYVPAANRGRNLQASFFDFIKSVADQTGESFAIFADPFEITNCPQSANARQALVYFCEHGYHQPARWMKLFVKQRQRFLDAGFLNVKYNNAQVTEPWQQFFYLSKKATDEERRLVDALLLEYEVNWKKLDETG